VTDDLRIQGMLQAVADSGISWRRKGHWSRSVWPMWAPMLTGAERSRMNTVLLANLADYTLLRNLRDHAERRPHDLISPPRARRPERQT
jgi:hypothetical protein